MLKQIDWACDKNVLVCFDKEPLVMMRVVRPEMSKIERQAVLRYPFVCKKPLRVLIYDHKKFKQYDFVIRENYCFDGATIPRFFWRLIGPNTDNQFLVAALVHDVLCLNHKYIDYDRELSSKVFRALLIASGVSEVKANIMYTAVDTYQKFWVNWNDKKS